MGSTMFHMLRLLPGKALSSVPLHQVRVLAGTDPEWLSKRRSKLADWLVGPGNAYLALQGAPSYVLSCPEWIAWEVEIAGQLGRDVRVSADDRGLEFPRIPGVCLDQLLRSECSVESKLPAVALAVDALNKLHELTMRESWPLSHGDATARNVVIDLEQHTAHWIDFETRHRAELPAVARRADDFRALLWSSAMGLDEGQYPRLVALFHSGCSHGPVWKAFVELMRSTRAPSVFELAQSPLSPQTLASLRAAFQRVSAR